MPSFRLSHLTLRLGAMLTKKGDWSHCQPALLKHDLRLRVSSDAAPNGLSHQRFRWDGEGCPF